MEKLKKIFKNKKIKLFLFFTIILFAILFVIDEITIYNKNIEDKKNHTITEEISNMNNYHVLHSAILLNNGNVLIFGGSEGYDNAEIYYTKSHTFKILKKQILTGICSADLLQNGHVIIIGGMGIIDFNPNNNLFIIKNSTFKRVLTKSIYLNNNKIFIIGGIDEKTGEPAKSCAIYNPANNKLEKSLTLPSSNENNIYSIKNDTYIKQLSNNKILIKNKNNIIIYNFVNRKILSEKISTYEKMVFTPMVINKNSILVLYENSKINNKFHFGYYNFLTNNVKKSNEKISVNNNFIMTKISNNSLLLTGVSMDSSPSNKGVFIFNTKTDSLKKIGNMHCNRIFHQSTLLNNKTVLITGGTNTKHLTDAQNTAEIVKLKL